MVPGPQAVSLLGDTLVSTRLPPHVRAEREAQLRDARTAYEANPADPDALIWYGRRTAYLGDYRRAIDIYTEGIRRHPNDPRLYRHRGHRYITVRSFDRAIEDLSRAAALVRGRPEELEPDGLPNARGIPTSTLQFNIWYHLGLAHYLEGDFVRAREAYDSCLRYSTNPDMLVASTYWLYMTLRRLALVEEAEAVLAPLRGDLDVLENDSYYRLVLMYQGRIAADALLDSARREGPLATATIAYGVGNWHLFSGRLEPALALFREAMDSGQWAAFGYIASEAELARLSAPPRDSSWPLDW